MNFKEISNGIMVSTTNEEESLLRELPSLCDYNEFAERQQFILDNLIKKDIIKRVLHNGKCYLVNNEKSSK